ncbi:MAG: B12-binding domain-containing radical SAM protein [Candidatus Omnitrophica bacterium]|nr:B12-binding domain-containing radical SAM protein [Candidatus Omnitrophota bacterium]
MGPVTVASAVNKMEKWDVEVIDENNLVWCGPKDVLLGADHEFLQKNRPADVVGFYGGLTSTIPRLYQITQFYKLKGIITIAGGQHFTGDNIAEGLSSGIDYIVIGEGEETIKDLIFAIEGKMAMSDVKGIAYLKEGKIVKTAEREPITDFDKLPLPDFSLVRYAKIKSYPVGRIRGCGMDCEFCTVKGKARSASPERLLESISFLVETKDARNFFIVDDLFGQERDETIRLCRMLKDYQESVGIGIRMGVQIRLDKAKDAELLHAMKEAGIVRVAIGFESPIKEELKAMNKCLTPEDMLSMASVFHKSGFVVHGMFIFGYPMNEGAIFNMPIEERVKHFRNFIKKAKLDTVQVLLPVPLPGTQLRERLQSQNRIYSLQDLGWEYYDGSFPLFKPDAPMKAEEMQAAAKKIMGKFYQFKYIFMIILSIFSFPAIIFFLHDIGLGWKKWNRYWHNYLVRFGGWLTIKGWTKQFNKDKFLERLQKAKDNL